MDAQTEELLGQILEAESGLATAAPAPPECIKPSEISQLARRPWRPAPTSGDGEEDCAGAAGGSGGGGGGCGCGGGDPLSCAICLSDFGPENVVTVLPCAGKHVFHPGCIRTWLGRSVQCPLCRADLQREGCGGDQAEPTPSPPPRQYQPLPSVAGLAASQAVLTASRADLLARHSAAAASAAVEDVGATGLLQSQLQSRLFSLVAGDPDPGMAVPVVAPGAGGDAAGRWPPANLAANGTLGGLTAAAAAHVPRAAALATEHSSRAAVLTAPTAAATAAATATAAPDSSTVVSRRPGVAGPGTRPRQTRLQAAGRHRLLQQSQTQTQQEQPVGGMPLPPDNLGMGPAANPLRPREAASGGGARAVRERRQAQSPIWRQRTLPPQPAAVVAPGSRGGAGPGGGGGGGGGSGGTRARAAANTGSRGMTGVQRPPIWAPRTRVLSSNGRPGSRAGRLPRPGLPGPDLA
eukprot:SAG22_NODE_951_length_6344_cov_2.683747_5_plen_465_part_00